VKKQAGFTLVEFLVAMGISLVLMAAAVMAFTDGLRTSELVTFTADMNDNLRASLDLMTKDLLLAGEGIPPSGINIPSGAGITINRPNLTPTTFSNTILPAVSLGTGLGPGVQIYNTPTSSVAGPPTDILTVLYDDNTWNAGESMDFAPLNRKAVGTTPACAGTLTATGDSVTFDKTCNDLSKTRVPIQPGDLILFTNPAGVTAIQTVTDANGQVLTFAKNTSIDQFGFNQTGASQGTLIQLQNRDLVTGLPNGTYPPITATRIFMVTYYLNNIADPLRPRLMRQLNFNPAQPVGDVVEAMQVRFNFVDGNTPPTFFPNFSSVPPGLNENHIRSVNIFLGARSNRPTSRNLNYLRDNLSTQVSLRSLSYFNRYQ
jgi:prepilin-type N-terminal cleavage/methylation domain-containing protein